MTRARSHLACASAEGNIHDAQALHHVCAGAEHIPHTPPSPPRQGHEQTHEDGAWS
jgi:hypothetical protein